MRKKMSLTRLSQNEMENLNAGAAYKIRADDGRTCGCGCYYSGTGGSNTGDNQDANWEDGLYSVPQE